MQALSKFKRRADTNQRISFDVDPSGTYLVTGSVDRRALVYKVATQELVTSLEDQADAVNAVSFHPYAPLLGLCTGQRHFDTDEPSLEDGLMRDVCEDDASFTLVTSETSIARNSVAIYGIGKPQASATLQSS